MLIKTMMWVAAIAAAAGVGTVGAELWSRLDTTAPAVRNLQEISQTASATDNGVTLTAIAAAFSGTETVVRFNVTVDSTSAGLEQALGEHEVLAVGVAPDGLAGSFAGYTVDSSQALLQTGSGELTASLPAIVPPPQYDGTVAVSITALSLGTSDGPVRLDGIWDLALQGPAPTDIDTVLWRRDLTAETISVDGRELEVSGTASATETRIRVSLPDGIIVLGLPKLRTPEGLLGAMMIRDTAAGIEAKFPPASPGATMSLDLGELGVTDTDEDVSVTIDVANALSRAPEAADGGSFAIGRGDIVSGRGDLVVSGEVGAYGVRTWLSVRLDGNWHRNPAANPTIDHPEDSPVVFDQDGNRLGLAHVQVGYAKDDTGNILPGVTDIGVFVDDVGDVEQLRLLIGPSTQVASGPHVTELTPVE